MDPEEIAGLSNEDLAAQIAQFRADLDAALATEDPTADVVAEATRLDAALSALEDESSQREQRAADFAAIRDRQDARAEQASTAPAEPEESEDSVDSEDEEDEEDEPQQASVQASARQAIAKRGAPSAPPAAEPEEEDPFITLIASADVPGYATGSTLTDLTAVGDAAVRRMKAFPKPSGQRGGPMTRFGVAQIEKHIPDELTTFGAEGDFAAVNHAANESRLKGGSLTAAGGWCSPSETIYDLCAIETTDGLLDLPEFNVSRGGVRFTEGTDFSTLYANGFKQTEAQAIAGTTKPCYEVECPEFEEVRLDAHGICIKVPLLTQAGYPEQVRNTLERSLIAYQHKQSTDLIDQIVAKAGAPAIVPTVGSTAVNTLNTVELLMDVERQNYRLSMDHTMEALIPFWVRGAIRADLAMRTGQPLMSVTNEQINAHFAARNTQVQWLYNMDDALVAQDETTNALAYPGTFNIVMYPAGTMTKGTASVINLDAVYDAAELSVNRYTGLFFEEGILLLQRCYRAKAATVTVCSGGRTGAADNVECLVSA